MKNEEFEDLMRTQPTSDAIFFGDWHGDLTYALGALERAYEKFPHINVYYHVGDFGVWPGAMSYVDEVAASLKSDNKIMIVTGGNHEDWDLWDQWVEDGSPYNYKNSGLIFLPKYYKWTHKQTKYISVGGASSIDQNYRFPGTTWWPQEVISEATVDTILATEGLTTDILITHESSDDPVSMVQKILDDPIKQSAWQQYCIEESEQQRKYVSQIIEHVKPTKHFHGHWHIPQQRIEKGLLTVSLGANVGSSYAENSYVLEEL